MIEKNKYEKIIDVINDQYEHKDSQPNIYGKHLFTDKALIMLDTPRKEGAFHGSSFVFSCFKNICSTNGEIVTKRELEKDAVDNVLSLNCKIDEIHKYQKREYIGEEYNEESHVHFTCTDKDLHATVKIAKALGKY